MVERVLISSEDAPTSAASEERAGTLSGKRCGYRAEKRQAPHPGPRNGQGAHMEAQTRHWLVTPADICLGSSPEYGSPRAAAVLSPHT